MSKAMQGCCICLLALAVVAVRASPFARRDSNDEEVSESCRNALIVCMLPAISPYIGLNQTEIMEKFRNTPLSEHCSDWTTSGDCARQEINGESCSDVSEAVSSQFAKILEIYDIGSNYVCKEHFDKFDRNFRCLTSHDLMTALQSTCKASEPDDPEEICNVVSEYVDCTADVVQTECGEEASTINRELTAKLLDKILEMAAHVDCSTSKLANRLALIKKFLARV